MKIFCRSPYNYDMKKASDETGLVCPEKGKTQQHQKNDADINVMMRKYAATGQMPMASARKPLYGDFTGITDYQTALNTVKAADGAFMALPAAIRKRFENNPQKYLDFCENPDNLEEMQELGLVSKPNVEKAPKVPEKVEKTDQADPKAQ